ncbi:hypothetical protein K3217_21045 [bacterium BD-1]|nr:hypothetical protein [Ottowia caeni]
MARRSRRSGRRDGLQTAKAVAGIAAVLLALGGLFGAYYYAVSSNPELDASTMCPVNEQVISSATVLLVDVTDPMNLPQRQDFINQLNGLADQIPRYGKLSVFRVDPVGSQLLQPIIVVCNPGTPADTSEWSGNPKRLGELHRTHFREPLESAFDSLMEASGADRSPILESIQSVNLTELRRTAENASRRLIVVSDLLQHTESISLYRSIPPAESFISDGTFARTRTDLSGVDVELWMLERADTSKTQPRELALLWDAIIRAQSGNVTRLYRISG